MRSHTILKKRLDHPSATEESSVSNKKPCAQSSSSKVDANSKQEVAAKKIQVFWRLHWFKIFFWKHSSATYQLMLEGESKETQHLAKSMYGRMVANIGPNSYLGASASVPSHAHYHRADFHGGVVFETVVSQSIKKMDLNQYEYIPLSAVSNYSTDNIIKYYINPRFNNIEYITLDTCPIILAKVNKSHRDHLEIGEFVCSTGIVASPWELSNAYSRLTSSSMTTTNDTLYSNLRPHLCRNMTDLIGSETFLKLKYHAERVSSPTNLLASSLQHILIYLSDKNLSESAVKRIHTFLMLAETFYQYNYERYASFVYSIIHEISLFLNSELEKDAPIIKFEQFKQHYTNLYSNAFGLDRDEDSKYHLVAFPSLSGSHAFMTALNLAKKMKGNRAGVKLFKPSYFEFTQLLSREISKKTTSDIYLFSTGPIANEKGVAMPENINEFIRNCASNRPGSDTKPWTILIDTVTTLHEKLRLEPDVLALVESGRLSIIIHESQQKFGLLHSDQAQFGLVFGICSKQHYAQQVISQAETAAAFDLSTHVDMQIGSLLSLAASYELEKTKYRHFQNAKVYENHLVTAGFPPAFTGHAGPKSTKLTPFLILPSKISQQVLGTYCARRDSFGHFHTTYSKCDSSFRLSPNASDLLDTTVDALVLSRHKEDPWKQFTELANKAIISNSHLVDVIEALIRVYYQSHEINSFTRYFQVRFALDTILIHAPRDWSRRRFSENLHRLNFYIENLDEEELNCDTDLIDALTVNIVESLLSYNDKLIVLKIIDFMISKGLWDEAVAAQLIRVNTDSLAVAKTIDVLKTLINESFLPTLFHYDNLPKLLNYIPELIRTSKLNAQSFGELFAGNKSARVGNHGIFSKATPSLESKTEVVAQSILSLWSGRNLKEC